MAGNRPAVVLQERDRRLLAELGEMRVIDREQASVVAGFQSVTRANARLLALTKAGLLRRMFTGRNKAVYLIPRTREQKPGHEESTGVLFVEHQLGINSIYLIIKYRPVPVQGANLQRWLSFSECVSKSIPLIPDGYFEFSLKGAIWPMFLEVDLGTERLSVWQKKIQVYLQLAISGEFDRIFMQKTFRTLIVVNTERRLCDIRSVIARSTDKIFWLTTFERIHNSGFWMPIWLRPTGDNLQPLL
jgi:Replication-relaxation